MDKKLGFFQSGREYESRYINHKYLKEEKKVLEQYESVDYFTPHSKVYKVRAESLLHPSQQGLQGEGWVITSPLTARFTRWGLTDY